MQENGRENEDLRARTKSFALRVIRLVQVLPESRLADVPGKQLLRSATSVGANYQAARRARSTADFIAKLKIVEEEGDESIYWMELLAESGLVPLPRLETLITEGNALVAITLASLRTARGLREDAEDYG